MTSTATTPEQYLSELPDDRKPAVTKLHQVILENLPAGFESCINYGMIGYVVPHSLYPNGYHCDTKLPLPFAGLASQKNSINFYHMGMYANPEMLAWFQAEFPKYSTAKLDMGKSCVRFKKPEHIPFELIGKLMLQMTVQDWINLYETAFRKK